MPGQGAADRNTASNCAFTPRHRGLEELCQNYRDRGFAVSLLKGPEGKGLVRRPRFSRDERAVAVTLTEAGARLKERALDIPGKMRECMPLSDGEARTLYVLLYKLLENSERGGNA